jgi:hypothetical protein
MGTLEDGGGGCAKGHKGLVFVSEYFLRLVLQLDDVLDEDDDDDDDMDDNELDDAYPETSPPIPLLSCLSVIMLLWLH